MADVELELIDDNDDGSLEYLFARADEIMSSPEYDDE